MITIKNIFLIMLITLYPIGAIAQAGYYYKGEKIPLIINEAKVCMNIPKNMSSKSLDILKDIKVLDKIKDKNFDIYIIKKADINKLSAINAKNQEKLPILFSPCYQTIEGIEVFATPYITVRLKSEQDFSLLSSYAEKHGLKVVQNDPLLPLWYILSVPPDNNGNAIEIANALWESGKFAASVPDLCFRNWLCSNDPMFPEQWGLNNTNNPGVDISINSAWDLATGKNIKIAFIDSGVDMNHLDLASNISDFSYDTETGTSPSIVYQYHGTHCAGIAAAIKDNGIQIAGVAPDATILSISKDLEYSAYSPLKMADGIIWAYQHGADIISNSWYSPVYHEAIDEAIHNAFQYGRNGKGCIIVFSSGNYTSSHSVKYPANCNDTILVVGAINNAGLRWESSNYGPELDVVAPGVSILSTMPYNQIGYDTGTSMACPHVSGLAALILERNSELTVNEVNSIIQSNAKKPSGVNFNISRPDGMWNIQYGYGLVDAYSSIINTPNVVYIQNDTITGLRIVSADSIYVGKDVTNDKVQGCVTLGQGQITLKAKSVIVKNSTSVPLGTTLNIENK